jgi:hypothetical protein
VLCVLAALAISGIANAALAQEDSSASEGKNALRLYARLRIFAPDPDLRYDQTRSGTTSLEIGGAFFFRRKGR